jgi:hypothetical protein
MFHFTPLLRRRHYFRHFLPCRHYFDIDCFRCFFVLYYFIDIISLRFHAPLLTPLLMLTLSLH